MLKIYNYGDEHMVKVRWETDDLESSEVMIVPMIGLPQWLGMIIIYKVSDDVTD